MNFEKELNQKQFEAVTSSYQHLRIIAGAGSGKTRVLTYRIAYLVDEVKVQPWKILAITFTNKVAAEMRARVLKMVPDCSSDLTIRTFHSFAAYFLRHEIYNINFPSSFTILDEEDQEKLVKDIAVSMGYRKGDKIVGRTLNYIGSCKLHEKYPDDINIIKPAFEDEKECLELYTRYEEEKNKMLSLDFDDLLLKTNQILHDFPDVKEKWQRRIDHILVDEFQDTNDIEYKLIRNLMKPSCTLYVVGDPDQTIYTWRGANQNIILSLNESFPDIETVILDRNYRSTQNILDCANRLINHNKLRVQKNLYTEESKGEKVNVHVSPSTASEADFVAREILKLVQSDKADYNDIAILYRSNYITKEFETSFVQRGIPYRIYGGTKFFQRREIKDVIAFFHLIVNTKDDISFKRIINVPKRGIGETSEKRLYDAAEQANMSIYDYVQSVNEEDFPIAKKLMTSLKSMLLCIDIARRDIEKKEEVFSKILEDMINSLGYINALQEEDDGDERIENVRSLFEDIRHYLNSYPDSSFDEYLQNISLSSAQDDVTDGSFVRLMTAHTAKGLEFPIVFVVRFNESVFPHIRSTTEGGYKALEEERRLAYVAFTRAKERLYLTYAGGYSFVVSSDLYPSRFLNEAGIVAVESRNISNPYGASDTRIRNTYSSYNDVSPVKKPAAPATNGITSWSVGDIVIHRTLGKGVVIELEGDGIIKVNFENNGIKSLMGNHPAVSKGEPDA